MTLQSSNFTFQKANSFYHFFNLRVLCGILILKSCANPNLYPSSQPTPSDKHSLFLLPQTVPLTDQAPV
ncbi:protein NETWORKED 1A [Trifolium repens]|nr:protein NETWORKED 1A [Trifolium repens]